ncbi:MAG: HEAT repeat domain-containing protein, partial [Candidatus Hydrogenedentes bacterium]|nr:HEAT repeat domain-containing protein [Candidatus Hydrogenedentota bacterium]
MKSRSYPCSTTSTTRAAVTLLACVVLSVISASAFAEAAAPALDSAMSAIARFEAGQDSAPLVATTDAVIAAFDDAPGRAAIAKRLAALLESSATLQGKEFVCKQLYLIGGDEILPVLAKLLNDEKTADMARYALQRMPSDNARDVLVKALNSTSGKVRVGIINSLGERRETKSVKVLAKLVRARDAAEASAAICALGKIGDSQAAKALSAATRAAAPALRAELADARLKCAQARLAAGKPAEAAAIYRSVFDPKKSSPV